MESTQCSHQTFVRFVITSNDNASVNLHIVAAMVSDGERQDAGSLANIRDALYANV